MHNQEKAERIKNKNLKLTVIFAQIAGPFGLVGSLKNASKTVIIRVIVCISILKNLLEDAHMWAYNRVQTAGT